MADFEIVRSLLQDTPLIRDIIEIILDFVKLMHDGQYKHRDLMGLLDGTYTFMLNMNVFTYSKEHFYHEGEVDVVQSGRWFEFKFTSFGTSHTFKEGEYHVTRKMRPFAIFKTSSLSPNIRMWLS